MAKYFAEIKDDIVQRVIVVDNKEWCEVRLGGKWVETFMGRTDKHYAGKGLKYHPDKDNFSSKKPYDSWLLNKDLSWEAPIPKPELLASETFVEWNEEAGRWVTT